MGRSFCESANYAFGDPQKPVAGYGVAGVDEVVPSVPERRLRGFRPGSKNSVTYIELDTLRILYSLGLGKFYPGQTVSNTISALNKLEPDTDVRLYLPQSDDPLLGVIKQHAIREGLNLRFTRQKAQVAHGLVVPVETDDHTMDRIIFGAKPSDVAPLTEFDPDAGLHIFGPMGGDWAETFNNGKDRIEETSTPHFFIAGESQVKDALADLGQGNLRKSNAIKRIFNGAIAHCNTDEARDIVKLFGEIPAREPNHLIEQLQCLGQNPYVIMSLGKDGAMVIDQDQNIHAVYTDPLTGEVYTLGMGDQLGAGILSGKRRGESDESALVNGIEAARKLGRAPDAQSLQRRADEWTTNATADQFGHRYRVSTPKDRRRKPSYPR